MTMKVSALLGPPTAPACVQSATPLSRLLEWTVPSIFQEADATHADIGTQVCGRSFGDDTGRETKVEKLEEEDTLLGGDVAVRQ